MKHFLTVTALLLWCGLLWGCGAPASSHTESALHFSSTHPHYPEMAPYPNEMDFVDPKTGIFDDEGFSKVYDAWQSNQDLRSDIPQNYAQNLSPYFQRCIPAFLSNKDQNTVCSPLNVYMSLALLAESTNGGSRQEILALLEATDIESLRRQADQVWRAHYMDDGASACVLANSLWLDDSVSYNEDTAGLLSSNYYTSVFHGDLGSDVTHELFRSWLNDQTKGLLEGQIHNIQMDPATVMSLASTIYYRAKWSNKFHPEDNTDGFFHTPGAEQKTTFMNQTLSYGPYFWGEDFGAVRLHLSDKSKMWLILPDEGLSPGDLLDSGHALNLILGDVSLYDNQKFLRVNLSMPKFDIVEDSQLNNAMQALGITSVFDPGIADFTPILPDTGAWLDSVKHAARVKVDEEGVEAAAYTAMLIAGAAMPPEEEMDFVLDRPFLFVITSQDSLPLFAGVVNEP